MPLTEAQRKANDKYIKGTFDPVTLRVPKGKKEVMQEHANAQKESLNVFINRAIDEAMERDTKKADE